jgi:hypothetical protein
MNASEHRPGPSIDAVGYAVPGSELARRLSTRRAHGMGEPDLNMTAPERSKLIDLCSAAGRAEDAFNKPAGERTSRDHEAIAVMTAIGRGNKAAARQFRLEANRTLFGDDRTIPAAAVLTVVGSAFAIVGAVVFLRTGEPVGIAAGAALLVLLCVIAVVSGRHAGTIFGEKDTAIGHENLSDGARIVARGTDAETTARRLHAAVASVVGDKPVVKALGFSTVAELLGYRDRLTAELGEASNVLAELDGLDAELPPESEQMREHRSLTADASDALARATIDANDFVDLVETYRADVRRLAGPAIREIEQASERDEAMERLYRTATRWKSSRPPQ